MTYGAIDLYAENKLSRGNYKKGYLYSYIPHSTKELRPKPRPVMLICPGGGYTSWSEREGEPLAIRFMTEGYACFVLDYDVCVPHPVPLLQACLAIKYLRENAASLGIDPAHIAVMGFSAGGHLAASLTTLYAEGASLLNVREELLRPDAAVLCYPVVTAERELCHEGSILTISGGDEAVREHLSLEKRVTEKTPPAFIWHTQEDDAVPVENALLLALAYRKAGVPFELHVFENGWHGLSLANRETSNTEDVEAHPEHAAIRAWVNLALVWLENRGFVLKSVSEK